MLCIAALGPAWGQQSATYDLEEHRLNQGGNPVNGVVLASSSFRLSLDAIGDPAVLTGLSSASYRFDVGPLAPYPPPGEVLDLRFTSKTTLVWMPEKSVGDYALYRGLVSTLPGGYGSCIAANLPAATANDSGTPPVGEAYFYLVTAENRLDEEGTKGKDSAGVERPNPAPCP